MSKSGFFTMNRWMGKKNKDKTPNGKLSKSSTNLSLSVSTVDINETSQLEYNRITPLPAITSNAFEQTFRITVLLPKDQLYVTRLGARVPLFKLMELVCENKLLDSSKYEFRHPVDPSQVYSCDLTIGAVGLSEVRLCHKSDSYDTYSTDDVIKMNRTSIMRESLSSSEYSNRNFKHTTKSASPYSSSNSLNSMDSTGMNYSRSPISSTVPSLPSTEPPKMMAPPRKKRAAPRPPQPIPEKSTLVIENGNTDHTIESLKTTNTGLPRKDYYVSTPNLASPTSLTLETYNLSVKQSEQNGNCIANTEDIQSEVEQKNARNLHTGSVQNLSIGNEQKLPEPSPRKRLLQIKKKSAPAPPPRSLSHAGEDDISLYSIASSTQESPQTPVTASPPVCDKFDSHVPEHHTEMYDTETPQSKNHESVNTTPPAPLKASTPVQDFNMTEQADIKEIVTNVEPPTPVPRVTTTILKNSEIEEVKVNNQTNISKVLLNRTPTPEPRSLSTEPPDVEVPYSVHMSQTGCEDDDNVSKQADSGIGEPVPSPIPDSLPSEGSLQENKSTFESSSDDDDVKVYNFKLGKTVSKPFGDHKTMDDLTIIASGSSAPDSGETTPATVTHEMTPSISETSSWNFSIPISPPPNFADISQAEKSGATHTSPDAPITPKIKERPVLNFDVITRDKNQDLFEFDIKNNNRMNYDNGGTERMKKITPLQSPTTPLNEIVNELTAIINDKRIDTLIRKPEDQQLIEAAKPNTLSNFRISSNSQLITRPLEIYSNQSDANVPDDAESSESKVSLSETSQSVVTDSKQINTVLRAESFHSTATNAHVTSQSSEKKHNHENTLNSRSSSNLSLTKLEQNGLNLNRRRSSSELSIGEWPSLQSLEIIKTILNSRKNSFASGDEDTKSSSKDIAISNEKSSVMTKTKISHAELRQKTETETKVSRVELRPKTEIISRLDTEEKLEKANNEDSEAPKNPSKVYRYTGPPSINFSTWNERPKVQVAIKNEGDYIFGGKNTSNQHSAVTTAAMDIQSKTVPRSFRPLSSTFNSYNDQIVAPPAVAPKPTSIVNRMGIPEKEYRVPITVKPLQDYVVENDKQTETNLKFNRGTSITTPSTPLTFTTNTSTLPRTSEKNLNKTYIVRTPSVVDQVTLRTPTKIQTNSNETVAPIAPFGQNTLRKTGLKEKILAAQETEEANRQTNKEYNTTEEQKLTNGRVESPVLQKIILQNSQAQNNPKVQSAKLEIKLKKSMSVNVPLQPANSKDKMKTPTSAPIVPVAPPPPPNATFLKSNTKTDSNGDPRNQLLDAIRNFKREELNRI